jgi:gluconolactonase
MALGNQTASRVGQLEARKPLPRLGCWTLLALLLGCAAEDNPDESSNDGHTMTMAGGGTAHSGAGAAPGHDGAGGMHAGASTTGGMHAAAGVDSGTAGRTDSGDDGSTGVPTDGGAPLEMDAEVAQPIEWPAIEAAQIGAPVRIADDFSLAEGALWDPCLGALLFTDADSAIIHQLIPPDQIGEFRTDSNYANGINFDPEGRLLIAEMGPGSSSGRITRLDRQGTLEVVVDKGPGGVALHTTDDLIVRSDGTIYFTDPVFPHGGSVGVELLAALPIYRVAPDGAVVEESSTRGPNGIVLSPDEEHLYVSSFFGDLVYAFDVAPDGALSNRMAIITGVDKPDSMCIDAAGNLYVGKASGLSVFRPDGTEVTTIPIDSDVTNCGFGGEDGTTLYITAWTSLWRVDAMPIPGLDWQVNRDIRCD